MQSLDEEFKKNELEFQAAQPQLKRLADSAPAESLRPLWQEVERQQQQLTEYTNKQHHLKLSLQTQQTERAPLQEKLFKSQSEYQQHLDFAKQQHQLIDETVRTVFLLQRYLSRYRRWLRSTAPATPFATRRRALRSKWAVTGSPI